MEPTECVDMRFLPYDCTLARLGMEGAASEDRFESCAGGEVVSSCGGVDEGEVITVVIFTADEGNELCRWEMRVDA